MQKMGGWWRLWVVASVLLGVPTWIISANTHDVSDYQSDMTRVEAEAWVARAQAKVHRCGLSGKPDIAAQPDISGGLYSGSFYCTSDRQYILSYFYALLPGAILAAIGLTGRWVFRGFRTKKPAG
jgi:hypothetical protein